MRTFVVRIWDGAAGEPAGEPRELRGLLEEVTTGEATRFTRGEELLLALRRAVRQLRDRGAVPARATTDEEGPDA